MLFMDSTVTGGAYGKLVSAAVVVTRPANWTNSITGWQQRMAGKEKLHKKFCNEAKAE